MATNRHDRQIDPPAPIDRPELVDRIAWAEAARQLAAYPEERCRALGMTTRARHRTCYLLLGAAVGL